MQPVLDFLGQFVGGAGNALVILLAVAKIAAVIGGVLGVIPFVILFERKIIAWVQDRPGPNRAGPWGVLHGILDGVKLFLKEDMIPTGADKVLYIISPALVTVPALLGLCLMPIGPIIQGDALTAVASALGINAATLGPGGQVSQIALAITNPNVGLLYLFAIQGIAVYGITIAGWASNSKFALLGGIRASAQMISYEISMALSILGVILLTGSLNLYDVIEQQSGGFWNWFIFAQPLAFCLFLVSMFAETNRLPFDLAEGESELTGGFHTEYSSMKFALFFLGEYVNMITASVICSTLFLGGYTGLVPLGKFIPAFAEGQPLYYIAGPLILPAKIAGFIFLFILTRATLPRMRYDQLMNLGWKIMLPLGLGNLLITTVGVGLGYDTETKSVGLGGRIGIGVATLALLLIVDTYFKNRRSNQLMAEYRNVRPV